MAAVWHFALLKNLDPSSVWAKFTIVQKKVNINFLLFSLNQPTFNANSKKNNESFNMEPCEKVILASQNR